MSNSNLVTHQIRAHLTPSKSLGTGLIGYVFQLDQPESYAPGVTSKSLLLELDAYGEWKVNNNFLVILVAAYATPQEAAEQAFDRTDDFFYGVVYVGYSY